MRQRGRKSAVSLMNVVHLPGGPQRPKAPDELTAEEAVEWDAVVARMPAEWFTRETHGQLVNYCRHIVRARALADEINGFDRAWLKNPEGMMFFDKLTHMAERESRAIASLGTKMRLTQQSRFKETTAGRKADAVSTPTMPWSGTKRA